MPFDVSSPPSRSPLGENNVAGDNERTGQPVVEFFSFKNLGGVEQPSEIAPIDGFTERFRRLFAQNMYANEILFH